MKHESCKNCKHYWEPYCHFFPIPIWVLDPGRNYCESHKPNNTKKK